MEVKKEQTQTCDLNNILTKMKSRRQIEEFFQYAGKREYLKLGYYFPNFPHSNSDFAFRVLKGEKKVNNYLNFKYNHSFYQWGNKVHHSYRTTP